MDDSLDDKAVMERLVRAIEDLLINIHVPDRTSLFDELDEAMDDARKIIRG